jgi:hypothetical protein
VLRVEVDRVDVEDVVPKMLKDHLRLRRFRAPAHSQAEVLVAVAAVALVASLEAQLTQED